MFSTTVIGQAAKNSAEKLTREVGAAYTVSGYVKDHNGYSSASVEVVLSNASEEFRATSNYSGYYEISGVPSGSYIIELRKAGHVEYRELVIKGEDLVQNFQIKNTDDYELGEVLLNVESVKSEIEKKGFAVNVIETEEAAVRNIQTNELLNRSVGVKIRQGGGLGSSVDYNLNGMSGNSIQIFIDGIPLSSYGSSFDLSSISPSMIERIDVYKGVVPAELAFDALGGAINVILRDDFRTQINASVSYGSFNTLQSNFNAVYQAENSGFFVKASGFYNHSDNDYEVWGRNVYNIQPNGRYEYVRVKRFNDEYSSRGGILEAGFKNVKFADHFSVGYTASDSYNEIQHGAYMTIPYKGRFMEAEAGIVNLTYEKSDLFVKGLDLNFHGLYNERKRTINDTVTWVYNWSGELSRDRKGDPIPSQQGAQQGAPTIANIYRDIYSFRAGLSYSFNKNHKIGLHHVLYNISREQNDELWNGIRKNFVETRELEKNISSFSYESRWFNDNLKANVFVKYYQQKTNKMDPGVATINGEEVRVEEYFSSNFDYTGYGMALSYLVNSGIAILGSAEKAIRLPTDNEIFGDVGDNVAENSGLEPEQSNNYNLGFKLGPYKIADHSVSLYASGFLRDTRGMIVREPQMTLNDAQQTAPFVNMKGTESKGFDAELNYVFKDNLNLLVNLSKFNTRVSTKYDSNGNVLFNYNAQIPSEPFFTANASARYSFKNVFQEASLLNIYYNYAFVDSFYNVWVVNKRSGLENSMVPEQHIQDVGLSYVFPNRNLIVSFDANNIFNKQAFDNFAVQKPGRAFYLKLNYSINNL
ncbi:TonB-dependent receptor [Salinimicrobium tongyeongense]|uniref:TonB-dependent receptor n=1 Tax=Salinimicrobium tongyeongense TaxID=2809707 RepID=A0ABY6NMJ1_9FLAO|nr:TonB-dependent receptor [Salinimicrobium tongyeongense]UZH54102.1 TonB-dependent receptor [Salinimicrobium tongyeongense]